MRQPPRSSRTEVAILRLLFITTSSPNAVEVRTVSWICDERRGHHRSGGRSRGPANGGIPRRNRPLGPPSWRSGNRLKNFDEAGSCRVGTLVEAGLGIGDRGL